MEEKAFDVEMETVEITTNPVRTWKNGIRMIPAIQYGDQILAGFTLSKASIVSFLKKESL